MAYTIQIVTASRPQLGAGLISSLAKHWQADGHRIEIGPARSVTADIAIMHIDLTRVPPRHIPENPRHRPLLNGAVLDISKRRISANLLARHSSWRGPVIVKTDANAMGGPEFAARAQWAADHKIMSRFLALLGQSALPGRPLPYRILPDIAAVPPEVWDDKGLVVEQFTPERHGELFVLRMWIFFGDKGYLMKMFSKHAIVKLSDMLWREYSEDDREAPAALKAVRQQLGFDYGKFDYVVVDGQVILLDVNKTPFVRYEPTGARQSRLATGLYTFLQ